MKIIVNQYSSSYNKGKEFMSEDEKYLIIKNWRYKPHKGIHATYDWMIMKRTSPKSWSTIDINGNFITAQSRISPMKFKNIQLAKNYVLSQYKEG